MSLMLYNEKPVAIETIEASILYPLMSMVIGSCPVELLNHKKEFPSIMED